MESKSLSTFAASIRASFRSLWSGQATTLDFADSMYSAIRRGFEQAWQEGSESCGILANERTQEESKQLGLMIGDNFQYVAGLADWIFQHSKANGGSWESVVSRAKLWSNRYEEVKGTAMAMSCKNKKLEWRIGKTERHCRSCIKLNGRIHRSSLWNEKNIHPRMTDGRLACNGYNCDCRFLETDQPATKGRFPNLP